MIYKISDSNYPGIFIREIEKEEYESIKSFSKLFYLYEGVLFAFSNYNRAKLDNEGFKKSLETFNSNATLDEIQRKSVYPITTEIIFLNTFLDNTKNFNKIIESKKIEYKIKELNRNEKIKILRAVRNYAIHASVPVKATSKVINLLNDTEEYKFYIDKNIILNNKPNKNDEENLKKFKSDKIILNYMIQEVSSELEELNVINFTEFIKYIPEEIKEILYKYVSVYTEETGKEYFANIFSKNEVISESKGKRTLMPKESIYFDPRILKAIVSQIYPDRD